MHRERISPFSFSGRDGFVAGTVTDGFLRGATNRLRAVVNNTFAGALGTPRALYGGDATYFGVAVEVSYSSGSEAAADISDGAGQTRRRLPISQAAMKRNSGQQDQTQPP